ncbi:hypothetical protein ACF0H5_013344 [Mactra antiquata]
MVVSEPCSTSSNCVLTTCLPGFDKHCVDNFCICQSPTTGVSCSEDDQCANAGGGKHCYSDREWEWKCVDGECYCRH